MIRPRQTGGGWRVLLAIAALLANLAAGIAMAARPVEPIGTGPGFDLPICRVGALVAGSETPAADDAPGPAPATLPPCQLCLPLLQSGLVPPAPVPTPPSPVVAVRIDQLEPRVAPPRCHTQSARWARGPPVA